MTVWQRLFDATTAFDHPVTVGIVIAIAIGLISSSILVRLLRRTQRIAPATYQELLARTRSWYLLVAAMLVPILLGAAWVWLFFLMLSLFCFREYSRATGLDASRTEMAAVVVAIFATYFAVLDHWMGFFTASWALGFCLIATAGIVRDQPQGYIQRVALAIVGYALFGVSLGHLAFISNDDLFRPILLWILLSVELNDVFAYLSGKTFGKRKLIPNTSPNKTWGGAIGATILTSAIAALVGHYVFRDTGLDTPVHLLTMGSLIAILGQCGDLLISSIKRDLGIKDMSDVIPGHGGLLDRFDSLLLVAPVIFHYINYFKDGGIGAGQAVRIISAGLSQ